MNLVGILCSVVFFILSGYYVSLAFVGSTGCKTSVPTILDVVSNLKFACVAVACFRFRNSCNEHEGLGGTSHMKGMANSQNHIGKS